MPILCQVLDIRKGEAESIIRELTCGRRRRHGQASLVVRFHIQLISLIMKDMGDEYVSFENVCIHFALVKNFLNP